MRLDFAREYDRGGAVMARLGEAHPDNLTGHF
jgi:hypothetical protein